MQEKVRKNNKKKAVRTSKYSVGSAANDDYLFALGDEEHVYRSEPQLYEADPVPVKKEVKKSVSKKKKYKSKPARRSAAAGKTTATKQKVRKSTAGNAAVHMVQKPVREQSAGRTTEKKTAPKKSVRSKRKQVNAAIIRAAVFSVILVVGAVIAVFVLFKVGTIEVVGTDMYKASQIIEAAEIELGDNLFGPTDARVEKRVCKKLPYIASVHLRRELPATLIINVEQTQAKFAFAQGNQYLITDSKLKVLEKSAELPEEVSEIEGVKIQGAVVGEKAKFIDENRGKLVLTISELLAENKVKHVTNINVKNTVDLTAEYDNRVTILFGQETELEYKCKMAATALINAQKENKKVKGTVNVKQVNETKQAYFNPDS